MITPEMIAAAPDEPDHITALRRKRPRTKRDGSNGSEDRRASEVQRLQRDVADALTAAGFEKITLRNGPAIYTVWNTKTVLLTLRKKSKP